MSLLDSFDNNKKLCRECKEYFDITTASGKLDAMIGLCEKCFKKGYVLMQSEDGSWWWVGYD